MTMTPGSFPWLVAHDVRLNWRGFTDMLGGAGARLVAAVVIGGGIVLHLLAWPVVQWLSPFVQGARPSAAALVAMLVCTFTWMIAQSLFGAARALYDRGDLDLLLGSPLSAAKVFAAKAAAIATSTFGSIALLTLPVANMGALLDRPAWLGVYPALVGLTLIATALALAISIALFFLVGPRRARVWTSMTGAGIGGAFVLAAQIVAMLPAPMRAAVYGWIDGGGFGQATGLRLSPWLPIDAVRGDVGAMLVLPALGLALFAATVTLLGERFARASLSAAGASAGGAASRAGATGKFRAGLGRNMRHKEWRLLARDPNLFGQLGLQIIYTIPVAVVLLRNEGIPAALALAPTIVVIAAQVAASLAWITVSGEDAPELIETAPVSRTAVDIAKLQAVALPVLAIVALPLAGLALADWHSAVLAALFAAAAGTSTALLNFWHPMPGNRRGMLRRHSQSKLIALVEHGFAILWAIAIVLAMIGSALTIMAVALAAIVLAICQGRHRRGTATAAARDTAVAGPPVLVERAAQI